MEQLSVMALKPFWRWAVLPVSLKGDHLIDQPAMPFYRRKTAEQFAREMQHDLNLLFPYFPVMLYRKRWFRRFEEVGLV